ncbi:8525_t:CDS:2 [Funneliformis mosseae]|uniref:DNA-directed DNA polymerase n=1 Tax=Funneliformis mosseae TaxID=27381 RepID=A0A9N8YPW3_FUNMO|nr:8525_t:CDS:2 [Funneliformis mosseae]
MKFYSKAEKSSLAFYLNECGFESKLDMPFNCMFKYYKNALKKADATIAEQIREIAEYCIIDALSCQQLMIKRNVINEYREVASIAFISLSDAHYFAIGMKVSNLLSVYVFSPIKGLENRRPVTGLDFASLYPSLSMTYNLSPDKIILSRKHAESLRDSGKTFYKINFKFNGNNVLAWSIKYNNIPEEKGLYANVLEYLYRCKGCAQRDCKGYFADRS